MAHDTANPLDQKMLDTLRALQVPGAPDIISELGDMFQSTAPLLLEKIHDAIARGDHELLYKSAHSLKGNSATLGANLLAAHLLELERMGRMRNMQGVQEKLVQVETEYTRVLSAIEQERAKKE